MAYVLPERFTKIDNLVKDKLMPFKPIIPKQIRRFLSKWLYYKILYRKPTPFSGWGMVTEHTSPWEGGAGNESFMKAHNDLKNTFIFTTSTGTKADKLDGHLWRHWIITYTVCHAIEFANNRDFEGAECGVCDGRSAFMSLRKLQEQCKAGRLDSFYMHLYDAWGPMESGKYHDISIERTKRNLSEFESNIIYHKGYIPDSLNKPPSHPKNLSYLHIDMNTAAATHRALEFFYDRLLRGGIVLFDDYGWKGYSETKEVIDSFFMKKPGALMALPTGQAIYFR